MRFRSAGRLGPEQVGRRVSVRVRDDDGSARDIIGILEALDPHAATIARENGARESVRLERIIAAREVRAR